MRGEFLGSIYCSILLIGFLVVAEPSKSAVAVAQAIPGYSWTSALWMHRDGEAERLLKMATSGDPVTCAQALGRAAQNIEKSGGYVWVDQRNLTYNFDGDESYPGAIMIKYRVLELRCLSEK